MIPKRVQVAGVVAVVSLAGYFAAALTDAGRAAPISFRLPKFTAAEIDQIKITKNSVEAVLQKTDKGWRVVTPKFGAAPDREADQSLVDGIITTFKDGVGMDLSQPYDAAKGSPFGLDKDVISVALLNQGKELTNFQIGKKAGPNRTFIVPQGEHTVYRAMADLRRLFDKSAADYRPHNLWQVQFEKIATLTIQDPDGAELQVKRAEGPAVAGPIPGMQVPGPKIWEAEAPPNAVLDNAALDSIGRSLAFPHAADFADTISDADAGLVNNFRFVLTTEDGATDTLLLGKKDAQGRAYAKRDPDGDVVLLDKYTVDTLLKSPYPAPPALAPASMPASAPVLAPGAALPSVEKPVLPAGIMPAVPPVGPKPVVAPGLKPAVPLVAPVPHPAAPTVAPTSPTKPK